MFGLCHSAYARRRQSGVNNVSARTAIKAGTLGAALSDILSVNPVNGVATFSNLMIDLGGAGYVLTAGTATASGDSTPFTVNTLGSGYRVHMPLMAR